MSVQQDPIRSVLSGGIAGGIEIMITYPTEYVKTMMQLYSKYSKNGLGFCIKETYTNYGVKGFYRGLSPLIAVSIPLKAVRFGSNEWLRKSVFTQKTRAHIFLAGIGAGICEAVLVVTPAETLKVKLIHDRLSEKPKYKGVIDGVRTIVAKQGFSGTYKGLLPTVLKQGSNQGIRFLVYEDCKKLLKGSSLPDVLQTFVAGGIAGGASVLANTPADVIKTKMQGLKAEQYNGTVDCIIKVWQTEGLRGFYTGTVPRLSRVVLDVGITFAIFDKINMAFEYFWPSKKQKH